VPDRIDNESERRIIGSQYITYRNDSALSGKYIAAKNAKNYNPAKYPDPFYNLVLNKDSVVINNSNILTALNVSKSDLEESWKSLQSLEEDNLVEEELNLAIALSLENRSSQTTIITSAEKNYNEDLPPLENLKTDKTEEEEENQASPFFKN
nr:hypothetical protein [Parachlamydiaceae bacterium]